MTVCCGYCSEQNIDLFSYYIEVLRCILISTGFPLPRTLYIILNIVMRWTNIMLASSSSLGNFAGMDGKLYCKPHFIAMFKTKGECSSLPSLTYTSDVNTGSNVYIYQQLCCCLYIVIWLADSLFMCAL